jgi:hypothetical protein
VHGDEDEAFSYEGSAGGIAELISVVLVRHTPLYLLLLLLHGGVMVRWSLQLILKNK